MKAKTVTDLKEKIISAIDEIDISKVTIYDLKVLADTISVIATINDKPFDFIDAFSKVSSMGLSAKPTTLSDLKEGE